MDEVAFVESLFQPELRSTPQPSPGRTPRSLLISTSAFPPSSTSASSRSKLMYHGNHHTGPAASPGNSLRVGVGPEEEEAFRQLLNDHDFDESLTMAPPQLDQMVDHLNGSGMIEPIDLPKLNAASTLYDPAFKDVFLNMPGDSPLLPSPSTEFGFPQYKVFNPLGFNTPRGGGLQDPHRTPRNSVFNDSLMPVQPLSGTPQLSPMSMVSTPATNTSSLNAIQALQQAIWSNNPSGAQQRLHPNSIKHVMMAAASNLRYPSSSPLPTTLPPPPSAAASPSAPMLGTLWAAPLVLTPTGAAQSAPDLTRNISSKKSKSRKPSSSAAKQTPAASVLMASLSGQSPPKRKTPSAKAAVQAKPSPVQAPSVAHDSDSSQGKAMKGKKCIEEGCTRRAQSNSRCKAHGGGARCQYTGPGGCTRSSQGGGFCRAHGGGKRCEFPGCTRGQQRKGRCYVHGGIRKCQTEGCEKKDRGNGFCISHGGGKRCVYPGCARSVRRGHYCHVHEDVASAN